MYTDLGARLRRARGVKPSYRVIEDGDPVGYQSKRGRDGKRAAKIRAWKLPPRSPGLMPLDFTLWKAIEDRLFQQRVVGYESQQKFMRRLEKTARALPKSLTRRSLLSMRKRLLTIVALKGKVSKLD